jgi:hypothetical protein
MAIAEHLVATTRGRDRSLVWPERAVWLWERLRANFAQALSNVVMPDHVHLVAPPGLLARLRGVLSAFTAKFGVRFDVLEPEPANSPAIAGRMMRYGFFNPVRAKLVADPWTWSWSTLRDLAGAAYPVWTPLSAVATTLGASASNLLERLGAIGDLRAPPPQRVPIGVASLDAVRSAVASALRWREVDVARLPAGRRLFVQACQTIGGTATRTLADALRCSERSLRRYRAPAHPGLDAVLLCLGDARLRIGT